MRTGASFVRGECELFLSFFSCYNQKKLAFIRRIPMGLRRELVVKQGMGP